MIGGCMALALLLTGALLVVHLRSGPRRSFDAKLEPFECGEEPIVSPRQRHAVRFYVVAILFVVFDVEAIFFYPWAVVFRDLGWFGFTSMLVFLVPLTIGLFYEWMTGGLDW